MIENDENPIIYNRKDVVKESVEYFNGDELAAKVWINKYSLKDSNGNLYEKSPTDMHHRIASEIARIESKYPYPMSEEEIFQLLDKFKYIIPGGSPMSGIGNNFQAVSLSNCFVIGEDGNSDSYGSILKTDQEQVQLMKRRGGVGHTLEAIRPNGSPVKNSALTSTGVVPFMERYSNSTREVAQDGRRGALMLSMSIEHPDSEAFIDAKVDTTKVTGANISVKITDNFMESVLGSGSYTQQWPVGIDNPTFTKNINSKDLWKKIIHNAWKSAEPGVLFWDTIIRESVPDCYADLGFKTVSTNPCGEIPLCPHDSCRLLSVNLFSYVNNPFTEEASFDFELFKKHAQIALRMMDDIVDLEVEKIDLILDKIKSDPQSDDVKKIEVDLWTEVKRKCHEGRRTGVGITAEGDMLAALGLRYGTKEATDFSVEVHKTFALEVYRSSCQLAIDRGTFTIWDPEREKNNPFLLRIKEADLDLYNSLMLVGRRNIACLTIAPTGSVSILTQTTSGIEPAFSVAYKRRRKINPNDKNTKVDFIDESGDSWEEYNVFHPGFKKWLKLKGYSIREVREYNEEKINELIKISPYYKAMANDVDWVEKIRMQGKIQKWVDHSISVTVNLPENVSEELVNDVYVTAWKEGCKGCTIYREGSRSGVLITKEQKKEEAFKETFPPKRPDSIECNVLQFQNKGDRWICFIGIIEGKPYEVFSGKLENFPTPSYVENGKIVKTKGEDGLSNYDFHYVDTRGRDIIIPNLNHAFEEKYHDYAKMISGVLRHGMPAQCVVDLLDSLKLDGDLISTWKAGIKRSLKKFIKDGTKLKGKKCPSCGSDQIEYIEGCLTCKQCGHSKCG